MSGDELHPGHRSIRLRGADYSSPDFYFVTICATEKRCIFGRVEGNKIELNTLGRTAHKCWAAIPQHFPQVNLHEFVVMPNHVHGVIELRAKLGRSVLRPYKRSPSSQVR